MDRVEQLLDAYRDRVGRPWPRNVSGPERVWIAVYPPEIERRLRVRIPEFGLATKDAGHAWRDVDLTRTFAEWLGARENRDRYFEDPDALKTAYPGFEATVADRVRAVLSDPQTDHDTVVALWGVGALFPMMHVSKLVGAVAPDVRGRLLVFFPGSFERGNWRLLDARDGWNYLAIPVTITEGASR